MGTTTTAAGGPMLALDHGWMPSVPLQIGFPMQSDTAGPNPSGYDAYTYQRHDPHSLEARLQQQQQQQQQQQRRGLRDERRENRRNFHRKVRTGCATCKARHVKCDEAKPACKRCTSTGRSCEGYPEPKKDRAVMPLLPRGAGENDLHEDGDDDGSMQEDDSMPMGATLGFFVTSDPREKHYLAMFMEDTFPKIWRVEMARPERWTKLVTQLLWDEPVVRHSAIALAAAHERQRLVVMRVRDDPSKFAMEYYNKAIQHLLREPPSSQAQKTRATIALLASCLMFVTIEMFLNRDNAVRTHLQSGIGILRSTKLADFAGDEIELLADNFEALDSHAMMYPGWGHSKYSSGMALDEARTVLDAWMPEPHFEHFTQAVRIYYKISAEVHHLREELAVATATTPYPDALLDTQAHLLAAFAAWQTAFDGLKASSGIPPGAARTAAVLECSVAVHTIVVRGACDATCLTYDDLEPEMRAVVPRIRAALRMRDPRATRFTVDTLANELMCLWYLFCVARSPPLRRQLRELCFQAISRRGVWCGMATCVVLDRVKALEEAGIQPRGADAAATASTAAASVKAGTATVADASTEPSSPPARSAASTGESPRAHTDSSSVTGPPSAGGGRRGPPGGPPGRPGWNNAASDDAAELATAADVPSESRLAFVGMDVHNALHSLTLYYRRAGPTGVGRMEHETLPLWH